MKEIVIEFKNVSFNYQENECLLKDVNLSIHKGEMVGIIGESGKGKSTILRLINGLITKRISGNKKGEVLIKNKNIDKLSLSKISTMVGSVFQNPDDQIAFQLVEDELAFGPENLCLPKEEILDKIESSLKRLGISHLRYRNPNNLSGGEKQLVNIAAIMTMGADILLLDESLSFLDTDSRERVLEAINLLRNKGITILMVEHDYDNLHYADKVYLLENKKLIEVNLNDRYQIY